MFDDRCNCYRNHEYDGFPAHLRTDERRKCEPFCIKYRLEIYNSENNGYNISDDYTVRVVTSDMQEQLIILGNGALRVSCPEFYAELSGALALIRETIAPKI